MDFSELRAHLASHGLEPVYLIQGQESFLKGEALRMIREKASSHEPLDRPPRVGGRLCSGSSGREGERPAPATAVDAKRPNWTRRSREPRKLFENLRTASLFAPRRLVVVDNAETSPSARSICSSNTWSGRRPGRSWRSFRESRASRSGSLPAADQGEEKKPGKAQRGQAPARKSDTCGKSRSWIAGSSPRRAAGLVRGEGARPGEADGRGRGEVARRTGRRRASDSSTAKFEASSPFAKERQRITGEDVSKLVGGDRARQFWDLTNAITARDAPVALRVLIRLMRDAESPGWFVGKIGKEFRRLIELKELSDQRLPPAEIAERAGMPTWLAEKLLRAVKDVSVEELKANLRLVLEADVDCKTGRGRDRWILERLVLKLCGLHTPAARV